MGVPSGGRKKSCSHAFCKAFPRAGGSGSDPDGNSSCWASAPSTGAGADTGGVPGGCRKRPRQTARQGGWSGRQADSDGWGLQDGLGLHQGRDVETRREKLRGRLGSGCLWGPCARHCDAGDPQASAICCVSRALWGSPRAGGQRARGMGLGRGRGCGGSGSPRVTLRGRCRCPARAGRLCWTRLLCWRQTSGCRGRQPGVGATRRLSGEAPRVWALVWAAGTRWSGWGWGGSSQPRRFAFSSALARCGGMCRVVPLEPESKPPAAPPPPQRRISWFLALGTPRCVPKPWWHAGAQALVARWAVTVAVTCLREQHWCLQMAPKGPRDVTGFWDGFCVPRTPLLTRCWGLLEPRHPAVASPHGEQGLQGQQQGRGLRIRRA